MAGVLEIWKFVTSDDVARPVESCQQEYCGPLWIRIFIPTGKKLHIKVTTWTMPKLTESELIRDIVCHTDKSIDVNYNELRCSKCVCTI